MPPPPGDPEKTSRNRFGDDEENTGQESGGGFNALFLSLKDWIHANRTRALIFGSALTVVGLLGFALVVRHIVQVRGRPTLEMAVEALDHAAYDRSRDAANEVLKYAAPDDYKVRGGALYVLGVASCLLSDLSGIEEKQPYYLLAANYLQESRAYGFLTGREQEGLFYLGKSLYLAGEIQKSREPLTEALILGAEDQKTILWYLANAVYYDNNPDYEEALRYVTLFRKWPTTTRREMYEANLLESMILLHLGKLDEARKVFKSVPDIDMLESVQHFIAAQIAVEEARTLVRQAEELERRSDPTALLKEYREQEEQRKRLEKDVEKKWELDAPPDTQPLSQDDNVRSSHEPVPRIPTSSEGPNDESADQSALEIRPENPTVPDSQEQLPPVLPPGLPLPNAPATPPVLPPGEQLPENFRETDFFPRLPGHEETETNTASRSSIAHVPWTEKYETPGLVYRIVQMQHQTERLRSGAAAEDEDILDLPQLNFNRPDHASPPSTPSNRNVPGLTADSLLTGEAPASPPPEDSIEIVSESEPDRPKPGTFPVEKPGRTIETAPEETGEVHARIAELRAGAVTKYQEAVTLFQESIRYDAPPFRWARQAELLQGICFAEMSTLRRGDDLQRSLDFYASVIESFPESPEATAARFLTAETKLHLGDTQGALAGFRDAFEQLHKNENHVSAILTKTDMLTRTRHVFESMVRDREFSRAFTLMGAFRTVMPEEETYRLGAEALSAWGNAIKRQADATFSEERRQLRQEAEEKYRFAGGWYFELARYRYAEADYQECLWNSAENFRAGRDYRKAIKVYEIFLRLNTDAPHRQARALYAIGGMLFELDHTDRAIEVLKRCIEDYPRSTLIPEVRLLLSKSYLEEKSWDDASRILELNLNGEFSPKSAVYRDSWFALGNIYYMQGDYDRAIHTLEDAVQLHPDAIQGADARYEIARAYLARAEKSERSGKESPLNRVKERFSMESLHSREKALENYRECERLLRQRQDGIDLAESDALMLRNVLFGIGAEAMNLRRFQEAIEAYNIAATEYQESPDALFALMQIAIAYRALGNDAEAFGVVGRARILFERLQKAKAFEKGQRFSPLEWSELLDFHEKMSQRRRSH